MARRSERSPVLAPTGASWWLRRDLLWLSAGVILSLCLLLYARDAWGMLLYRLLTDASLAVFWILAAAGAGIFPLRFCVGKGDQTSQLLRFTSAAGLGMGIFSLLVLVLGLAGALNRLIVLLILAI